ncbi:MAG: hypothetical protein AAF840_10345 [Bacteroidota bacterium]
MLTIYSPTKYHEWIHATITTEDRLHELVRVVDYLEERPLPSAHSLLIKEDAIWPTLDWFDEMPPYLLAEKIELKPAFFLALVFARLNNYERVYHYLAALDPSLNHELDIYNRLQHGLTINTEDLPSSLGYFDEYRLMHNHAVVRHYGSVVDNAEQTKYFYLQALETAPNGEYRAYSARQFGNLLMDGGEVADAIRVLKVGLASAESKEGKTALRHALCQAMFQQLSVPYDSEQLSQLKDSLWQVLQAYEQQKRPLETAMVLLDTGSICQYEESWSEGLGYLSRAIELLDNQDAPALLADAHLRKGGLLFSWAQRGNAQFYRKAAESLQRAARTFTRSEAPLIYADIQQRLGLIYAEIPDDAKKKGMWAAVSSTAFQEALGIFTRDQHPQQYASTCNHYGNALMKYPKAKLTDNVEKALYFYQEALELRPAATMPLERSLTLLNFLEGQWHLGMAEDELDELRYANMEASAREVVRISPDPALVEEAHQHLEKLALLKAAYA